MIRPEQMHYQALELPSPRYRVRDAERVRYFDTLDEALAYVRAYHERTGCVLGIEERKVRR